MHPLKSATAAQPTWQNMRRTKIRRTLMNVMMLVAEGSTIAQCRIFALLMVNV